MNRTNHQLRCPIENWTSLGDHSDAAKRVADIYNMHRYADPYGCIRKWIACALVDGNSDNVLYDSKMDAIRHQHHNENYYTFIQMVPSTMTPCEAAVMLKVARMLYDKGWRMTDPAQQKFDIIKRSGWEDQLALSEGHVTNIQYGRIDN